MGDMDSGNSGGSMQSSSTGGGGGGGGGGDDQEYESRGGNESISAFYNNPMSTFNLDSISGVAASPLQLYSFSNGSSSFPHHQNHLSNYFDQCSNFMLNHHTNSNNNGTTNTTTTNNNNDNSSNNNDGNQLDNMVWSNNNKFGASIRPDHDPNCTSEAPLIGYHQQPQPPPPPPPPRPAPSSGSGARNPKKRSRASRRAPTTVLTTDTSNFRQMVQEFTGIPAPPFTGFSTRARFDLFNGLGLGLGPGPGHSNPPPVPSPSYLLRPLPQKMPPLHQPPPTTTAGTITSSGGTSMNMAANVAPESTTFINLCDPDHNFMNANTQPPQQLSFQPGLLGQPQDSSVSSTIPHHNTSSVDPPASGSYRGITTNAATAASGALDNNNEGATKGEGMVDSWICSSD